MSAASTSTDLVKKCQIVRPGIRGSFDKSEKVELSADRLSFELSRVELQLVCVAESIDHLAN